MIMHHNQPREPLFYLNQLMPAVNNTHLNQNDLMTSIVQLNETVSRMAAMMAAQGVQLNTIITGKSSAATIQIDLDIDPETHPVGVPIAMPATSRHGNLSKKEIQTLLDITDEDWARLKVGTMKVTFYVSWAQTLNTACSIGSGQNCLGC